MKEFFEGQKLSAILGQEQLKAANVERQSITVEPRLATTPLIRPPRYYGHFILARSKGQSVIFQFKKPL